MTVDLNSNCVVFLFLYDFHSPRSLQECYIANHPFITSIMLNDPNDKLANDKMKLLNNNTKGVTVNELPVLIVSSGTTDLNPVVVQGRDKINWYITSLGKVIGVP